MAANDPGRQAMREAGQSSLSAGRLLLSLLVAVLPVPWRSRLDQRLRLEPERVATLSSALQAGLFLLLWGLGLAAYMSATKMVDTETFDDKIVVFFNPALPIVYLLTTWQGFLTGLAAVGGAIRLFSAVSGQGNIADPTLLGIEALRRTAFAAARRKARERAKGEYAPDLVEHGRAGGAWDLRVSSHEDSSWNEGTGLQAFGRSYIVLSVEDREDEAGRLRVVHELRFARPGEVLRGVHAYRPRTPPRVIGEPPAPQEQGPDELEERKPIPLAPEDPRPR